MQATWAWCVAGLVCLGLEVVLGVPVVLLFFALACFVTALVAATGLIAAWPMQAVLAAATAVTTLVVGRRRLLCVTRRMGVGQAAILGEPVGAEGLALDAAEPGASLRVELFGVPWRGKNVGTSPVAAGAPVTVMQSRGLTLDVVDGTRPGGAPAL